MKHDIDSEAISPEMIFHKCPGELRIYIDFGFLNLYRYERSHKPKDAVKSQIRGMLAVKLHVPHHQLNEPTHRTVQSSRWSWEVNPDDEPGLPLDSSRSESLIGRHGPPSFPHRVYGVGTIRTR